jgi:predicted N-acetyltransferase YhbS
MPPEPKPAIRRATPEDASPCGEICYSAFSTLNAAHGFPCDFPSAQHASAMLSSIFARTDFYCVVAEVEGHVVGSNALDERSIIRGVGPVSIDPRVQNLGVGRKLMQAVMDRARQQQAPGIRLVQAAFHNRSFSLYTSLGFDIREPLSCLQGRTLQRSFPGLTVRPAQLEDLAACSDLSLRVHGFDRTLELAQAIERRDQPAQAGPAPDPRIVERNGHITGYTASLAFFSHSTAETNLDMQALIASAESFAGPGILVPSRNTALLRWCLANGLRVIQPMTLMSIGLYNEPAGAWLPSISF